MCLPAWYPWKSEEGIRCPGNGVTDACEPPSQYWGLNSSGKWASACNCWVAPPAPYPILFSLCSFNLFMGSLSGSFQNLSMENCNIMHISVCEFHNVFKRIKLHNYYYLDKLEVLVSLGCTMSSSRLQVLVWVLPLTFVKTLGETFLNTYWFYLNNILLFN